MMKKPIALRTNNGLIFLHYSSFYSFCLVISLYATFDDEEDKFVEFPILPPLELFLEKFEELLSGILEAWFEGSNGLLGSGVLLLVSG